MKLRTRQILLAFAGSDDAEKFKRLLVRRGYYIAGVCNSGAQVLSALEDLDGEVVIIGCYRYQDMVYTELAENLPENSTMLLIANPVRVEDVPDNVVFLPMPIKAQDFLATVEMLVQGITPSRHSHRARRAERTPEEKAMIENAKALLQERHHMTETEAHRYLQKCAMDSGCDLVETASMVITLQ